MDFSLSEEQRILRDSIVQFARAELNHDIAQRDREHRFDRQLWQQCAAMGLLGLPVDERYGGSGADPVTTAVALEALGYGCHDGGLSFSICAHLLACVIPIWKHGTEQQKREFLPGLCDGRWIAVNAMTETETGSDSFAMRTRATAVQDGWSISGSKTFCSNGPVADVAVVYAATDPDKGFHGGVTVFLVTRDSEGFAPGQRFEKMGLRTSPISELVFDNVFVPHDRVLGTVGGGGPIFTDFHRVHGLGARPAGGLSCRHHAAADGNGDRTRAHAPAVWPDHRQVPGGLPPYCRHQGARGRSAPAHLPGRITAR